MYNIKMRKLFLIIFLFIITVIISIVVIKFQNDLIAIIKDFLHIKPSQYIGATVDMSQILPESQYYIKNNNGEDLIDLAHRLGMNTLRITNITSPIDGQIVTSYTKKQWSEVLKKMQNDHMYAVILVESNSQDSEFFNQDISD